MPTIIDVNAEAAKLTMFRGKTPKTTRAERKGSAADLARYRDGLLLLGKSAGKGHWETHPADELVWVLQGSTVLDIVEEDGPQPGNEITPSGRRRAAAGAASRPARGGRSTKTAKPRTPAAAARAPRAAGARKTPRGRGRE